LVSSEAIANTPRPIKNVIPEIEAKPGRNGLIVYVQQNRNRVGYLGASGIYSYNPRTHKHKLLVKSKHASHPRFTANGDQIVYVDEVNREARVYSMDPDGSDKIEIADDIKAYPYPVLIPGNRVWYANSEGKAFTVRIDGSGLKRLGKVKGEIAIGSATANGSKVVYQSEPGVRNVDIFIYNRSTGKHTRLTNGPKWEYEPRISPDGRWVTFVNENREGIWLMRANGKEKHRIAYSTGDLSLDEPLFAPDGVRMLMRVYVQGVGSYLSRFSLKNLGKNGPFRNIDREGSVRLEDADWQTR
jgi:Tol biopolymer transport system component